MLVKIKEVIKSAPDRESFFKIIASIYPTLDSRYELIVKAYNDAKDAFREEKREDGDRYFEHLRAVALILLLYIRVKDYRLIIAALLHDIVEDIPSWTIERVQIEYDKDIAVLVEWMTKPKHLFSDPEECLRVYHSRFDEAPREFFILKLADRLHNLLTIWACSNEKKAKKMDETIMCYLPYAEKHFILLHEIEAVLQEIKVYLEKQTETE